MSATQELMSFNITDYVIASVILVSMLISLLRGFFKEFVSLFIWVLGFWVAMQFYHAFAIILEPYIASVGTRQFVSFGIIFVLVLIIGAIFNHLLAFIITKSGLSGTDRLLGMVFGSVRGVLLVAVILLLVSSTSFVQDEWWKKSVLIPHLQVLIDWLRVFLPEKIIGVAGAIHDGIRH